jgi:hypothetical protein
MFQLYEEESENLRFHFGTSSQWGGTKKQGLPLEPYGQMLKYVVKHTTNDVIFTTKG